MEHLSAGDATALLDFVSDLRALDDPLAFPLKTLEQLRGLVPSDEVGYSEIDPSRRRPILQMVASPGADEIVRGSDAQWEETAALWWKLRPTHPVCGHRSRTGNWTEPFMISDFATQRDFHRTPIYDAFYRGDIERWLDVGLPATPTRTRVFIFTRSRGPEYEERDRLVLTLLQPHLAQRADDAEAAAAAAAAMADVADDASGEARRIVLCSTRGAIEFASQPARALLKRYLGVDNGSLPVEMLRDSPIGVSDGDGRLTIRAARTGGLWILLLDERDRRLDRLTPRERQILERVACGETNSEISQRLGIAGPTVAKHLEHVYEKLGVRSRTGAAALLNGAAGS